MSTTWKGPLVYQQEEEEEASHYTDFIDFLAAVQLYNIPVLPVSPQIYRGYLGRGLSGNIEQARVDVRTVLAFKKGVPSDQLRDNNKAGEWSSLVTELAVLQHPSIRGSPYVGNLLGVSFSIKGENRRRAWPILTTRKASLDSLDAVLRNPEQPLPDELRQRIFAHVIQSIYLLHHCSVAHGDIKPGNILVDETKDGINCILIDFGSCVVWGNERQTTMSPPWNAPELEKLSGGPDVGFDYLAQTDIFSLGLLCLHILVPLQLLRSEGLSLIREDQLEEDWNDQMSALEQAKLSTNATNSLHFQLHNVIDSAIKHSGYRSLLLRIVEGVIRPENGTREMPWDDALALIKEHVPTMESSSDLNPSLLSLPSFGSQKNTHDTCKHARFNLSHEFLAQLDDTDYVVRQTIMQDLEHKAHKIQCLNCKHEYTDCLDVCSKLDLGGLGKSTLKPQSLEDSRDIGRALEDIKRGYCAANQVPQEVLHNLAIGVLQTSDRISEYTATGRLSEGRNALEKEIYARSRIFEQSHKCIARLTGELARVCDAQQQSVKAGEYQRSLVDILNQEYGDDHPLSIMAELMLMTMLISQNLLKGAGDVPEEKMLKLSKILGDHHPDVISAKFLVMHIKAGQGDPAGAERMVQEVISNRTDVLGEDHPETLKAMLQRALLLRDLGNLKAAMVSLDELTEKLELVVQDDQGTKAGLLLSLAITCQRMGDLKSASMHATTARKAVMISSIQELTWLKVQTYQVEAYIYQIRRMWSEAETGIRCVVRTLGQLDDKKPIEVARNFAMLTQNLLRQGKCYGFTPPLAPGKGLARKLHVRRHSHWPGGGHWKLDHVIPIL